MKSIPQNSPTNTQVTASHWRQVLYARGLSDATIDYFRIRRAGRWLRYPIVINSPIERFKALPGQDGPKYLWGRDGKPQAGIKPDPVPFYDPCGELARHVAAADGVLILAEGEADVWALYEGGITNATATMLGAGKFYAYHVDQLRALGVTRVMIWPDRDEAGLKHAAALRDGLAGTAIALDVGELPATLGQGGDVGGLLLAVGAERLADALQACPPLALPEPVQAAPVRAQTAPAVDLPSDASELLEVEARTRAAIAVALVKRGGKVGVYNCPREHRQGGKDFLFNPEPGSPIGGCMGKHRGELTRWVDLADHLGIDVAQIARDVAAERRPVQTSGQPRPRPEPVDPVARRFRGNLPHTMIQRMLDMGLHNAALVWENWHQLDTPDDQPTSRAELQDSYYHLSRRSTDQGLSQLETLNIVRFETHTSASKEVTFQNVQKGRGRPAGRVIFLPVFDVLDHLEGVFANAAYERRHAQLDAPADVRADFAEPPMTPEGEAAANAARAPIHEAHADDRADAAAAYERDLRYIRQDFERIRRGAYKPFDFPPDVTSAAELRRALYKRTLDDHPDGIESYRVRRAAGISRATQSRIRKEYSIVIPQTEDTPVRAPDEIRLGRRQRAELIAGDTTLILEGAEDAQREDVRDFLSTHQGVILRKSRPALEKRRDQASEQEQAAYQEYSELQARRARAGGGATRGEEKRLLPTGYTTTWLLRQLEMTPGAEDLARYDADTGEKWTAPQLWHALAVHLQARKGVALEQATAADAAQAAHGNDPGMDRQAWMEQAGDERLLHHRDMDPGPNARPERGHGTRAGAWGGGRTVHRYAEPAGPGTPGHLPGAAHRRAASSPLQADQQGQGPDEAHVQYTAGRSAAPPRLTGASAEGMEAMSTFTTFADPDRPGKDDQPVPRPRPAAAPRPQIVTRPNGERGFYLPSGAWWPLVAQEAAGQ